MQTLYGSKPGGGGLFLGFWRWRQTRSWRQQVSCKKSSPVIQNSKAKLPNGPTLCKNFEILCSILLFITKMCLAAGNCSRDCLFVCLHVALACFCNTRPVLFDIDCTVQWITQNCIGIAHPNNYYEQ